MPDVQYGPPSWADWSDWEQRLAKAKAIQDSRARMVQAAKDQILGVVPAEDAMRNPQNTSATPISRTGFVTKFGLYGIAKRVEGALRNAGILSPKYGPNATPIAIHGYDPGLGPHYEGPVKQLNFRDKLGSTSSGVLSQVSGWGDDPVGKQLKGSTSSGWQSQGGIPTSRRFRYGEEPKRKGRAPKRESAFQREQRKRKEEEQDAFQRMLMQYNQGMQNSVSRPSIVPPVIWDAYVPDEGMSNYAVFDDIGRFEGIDMDAMLESMGVGPPPGYSKRKV